MPKGSRLSSLIQAAFASMAWIFFSQLGEPSKRRKSEEKKDDWLFLPVVDRQDGFDVFGLLDGALNYGVILRTIVLNIIAVSHHSTIVTKN